MDYLYYSLVILLFSSIFYFFHSVEKLLRYLKQNNIRNYNFLITKDDYLLSRLEQTKLNPLALFSVLFKKMPDEDNQTTIFKKDIQLSLAVTLFALILLNKLYSI